jgi:hypothetical protein
MIGQTTGLVLGTYRLEWLRTCSPDAAAMRSVEFFSDRDDQKSVFLSDAAWADAEGNATPIDGPGILLTADSGIETVLFLRHEEKTQENKPQQAKAQSVK